MRAEVERGLQAKLRLRRQQLAEATTAADTQAAALAHEQQLLQAAQAMGQHGPALPPQQPVAGGDMEWRAQVQASLDALQQMLRVGGPVGGPGSAPSGGVHPAAAIANAQASARESAAEASAFG